MSQESEDTTLTDAQKQAIRDELVKTVAGLLGIKYDLGAEWTDYTKPPAALDCSELVEGVYKTHGLKMPDGSQNQFTFTVPTGTPRPGDLAFFGKGADPAKVYHVGMVFDAKDMIEARGYQIGSSFETGKVILRPRERWEKWMDFVGYRAHPKLI